MKEIDCTLDAFDVIGLYAAKRARQIDATLTPYQLMVVAISAADVLGVINRTDERGPSCFTAVEEYLELEEAMKE
jgi:hypothetical protein